MRTNQIRISYNPYKKETQYDYRNGKEQVWSPVSQNSKLLHFQQGTLQNFAANVVYAILDDYCSGNSRIDLFFRGTDSDWADFQSVVQRIDTQGKIHCCDIEEHLQSALEILPRIDQIFTELSEKFQSEADVEILKLIRKYQKTVRPEVVLCVVGNYSEGKSTFINALIGEELLPSAGEPATAKIFEIRSLPGGSYLDTKVSFQFKGQPAAIRFSSDGFDLENLNGFQDLKRNLDEVLSGIEVSPAYIYKLLSALNNYNKQMGEAAVSDWIEIETPFYQSTLPLDSFQFIIYDTPGSDADKYQEHVKVLKSFLSKQTNGLPIFLTRTDHMSSTSVADLRHKIDKIGALDNSNILIVANKADMHAPSSLERIRKTAVEENSQRSTGDRIFFLSSVVGLGSKKEDMSQCVFEDTCYTFGEKKPSFLAGTRKLFPYDILPPDRYEEICRQGEAATDRDERQKLLYNSGLWAVENEIGLFARKYALYNKCYQAQEYLAEIIHRTEEAIRLKQSEQGEQRAKLLEQMEGKKRLLLEQLNKTETTLRDKMQTEYAENQRTIIQKNLPVESELVATLDAAWKEIKKKFKKDADGAMRFRAESQLQSKLQALTHAVTRYAQSYWHTHTDIYKDRCVRIVKESDALSPGEKGFLERYILNFPSINPPQSSFNEEQAGLKEWKFLFWKWQTFDAKACAENMKQHIMNSFQRFNQQYSSEVKSATERWYQQFREGLVHNLAEFNPGLKQMSSDLKDCEEILAQLEEVQADLRQKCERLETLITFRTP